MTPPRDLPPLPSFVARQQVEWSAVPPLRTRRATETGPSSGDRRAISSNIGDRPDADHRITRSCGSTVRPPREARARSLAAKREEKEELADAVRTLETQLEALRVRAGLPSRADRAALDGAHACGLDLEETLHQNDLYLGRMQSMVTTELLLPTFNPLSTFIHLPRAVEQREAILRSMQDLKLRRAAEIALNRLEHLDPTVPFLSEETFLSATGEYHYHRVELLPLRNFESVRQLHDTYVEFMSNLEDNVTELLGQISLHEDEGDRDPQIWNQRVLTVADNVGCTEELNNVYFAQFFNHSPATDSPMGVCATDTVNIDELYPYVPEERTCKDIQAAAVFHEAYDPQSNEKILVFKKVLVVVQLVPQFPISPAALKQLQDNTRKWPEFISKYLRTWGSSEALRS